MPCVKFGTWMERCMCIYYNRRTTLLPAYYTILCCPEPPSTLHADGRLETGASVITSTPLTCHTGAQLEQSVRFATNPMHTGMFDAGMLSINGTTVESVAANMRVQSFYNCEWTTLLQVPIWAVALLVY